MSTLYIHRTTHKLDFEPMNGGGRYTLQPPFVSDIPAHVAQYISAAYRHISTLHIWRVRQTLATCRALIYASLVDDPDTDSEREELLKEVAALGSWNADRHPGKVVCAKEDDGSRLTGTDCLKRAQQGISDFNSGYPPKLLDPFAALDIVRQARVDQTHGKAGRRNL